MKNSVFSEEERTEYSCSIRDDNRSLRYCVLHGGILHELTQLHTHF